MSAEGKIHLGVHTSGSYVVSALASKYSAKRKSQRKKVSILKHACRLIAQSWLQPQPLLIAVWLKKFWIDLLVPKAAFCPKQDYIVTKLGI